MQYNDSTGIQVIARAAAILRACGEDPRGLSLGDIARRTGLARSTVQRIAGALEAEGFLASSGEPRGLRLGPALASLGGDAEADVVEVVHPHLKRLSEQTGETVDLALFRRDHMVFVDQVTGTHRLRAVSAVGEKFPLDKTANGKAARAIIGQAGKEMDAVRRTGLAYDREEHTAGISAIGAAFKDKAGRVHAISVPMPAIRFSRKKVAVAAALKRTLTAVKRELGLPA